MTTSLGTIRETLKETGPYSKVRGWLPSLCCRPLSAWGTRGTQELSSGGGNTLVAPDCRRGSCAAQRNDVGVNDHRHRPMSFPEGELFDSPGFAAQRLPWVGDIQ
jgi:hypothetical protein